MPCDGTCGCKQTSPSVGGSTSAAGASWTDQPVTIPRHAAMGAVDFMARHAEDVYDRAMDEGVRDGSQWERFETFARDLHALASAIVEGE